MEFKDTFIKHIFGFFEPFHPCLALKLAKYKEKNSLWESWNTNFDDELKSVEKMQQNSPKKVTGRKVLHTE
jgi:hypothetical protein